MGRQHLFTPVILKLLKDRYGKAAESIFEKSDLLNYLNNKTQSATSGSKARSAFGKHFSLYALVKDYIERGYVESGGYRDYEGARFSDLFREQRSLPFGTKLQNHDLNNRINDDFRSNFPNSEYVPILHDPVAHRYWINENLLKIRVGSSTHNIAPAVLDIIRAYIAAKKSAFEQFLADCQHMATLRGKSAAQVREFIAGRLQPNVDARIFEIVSYAILKAYYGTQSVFWGWTLESIHEEGLVLYKTGRTNANDGGIDFVMRLLDRFDQICKRNRLKPVIEEIVLQSKVEFNVT